MVTVGQIYRKSVKCGAALNIRSRKRGVWLATAYDGRRCQTDLPSAPVRRVGLVQVWGETARDQYSKHV